MGIIKGEAVTLYDKVQTGTDEFNAPIYEEVPVTVENVLITPGASTDEINDLQLEGKRVDYVLSIPKGDEHDWTDKRVEFWGQSYKTFGFPYGYAEHLTPTDFNWKVAVERFG